MHVLGVLCINFRIALCRPKRPSSIAKQITLRDKNLQLDVQRALAIYVQLQ